jgi:glycosyltransferase involved in cell wall biosynthesis
MAANVAILLCTYNSAPFLPQQLASYVVQTHGEWSLHVNDDGSSDRTLALLEQFREGYPERQVVVHRGPGKGFVHNFLNLACRPDLRAQYYAFSDHDDVWYSDKLARAVAALADIPTHLPALYCSSSELIDERGAHVGYSQRFSKQPGFANALVQSIAGGNTMVFNEAARQLLVTAGETQAVPSHDWWLYQLVSGAGGIVRYDPEPTLAYRQHASNVVGCNRGFFASCHRIRYLMTGRFRHWNSMNCASLAQAQAILTPENRRIVENFSQARAAWLPSRLLGLRRTGIYRQTRLGNLGLIVAAFINRM